MCLIANIIFVLHSKSYTKISESTNKISVIFQTYIV